MAFSLSKFFGLPSLHDVREMQRELAAYRAQASMVRQPSGVDITWGRFGYEPNTDLRGEKWFDVCDRMANDPHVKQALRNIELPLMLAEWEFEAGSDDPKDIEAAELCNANLLRKTGDKYGRAYWCRTSPMKRRREILDMLRVGYSVFHKSWRVEGGKRVYDALTWLEPRSIDPTEGWILDDDENLVAIQRSYMSPSGRIHYGEPIPAEELALYVWDLLGSRLAGTAFIRSMYGPYARKDKFLLWAALWAQKTAAGIPVVQYPSSATPAEQQRYESLAQAMRGTTPDRAYAAIPMTQDGKEASVKYVGGEHGDLDRMRGLIDGENLEIAHAGGTKSMMLGETDSGSRALGESQGAIEMNYVEAVARIVAEFEMYGVANLAGLSQELVDANFANVKNYPLLRASKINPFENVARMRQFIEAKNAGLVPEHPEIRKIVTRQWLGLDLEDSVFEEDEARRAEARAQFERQPNANGDDESDGGDEREPEPEAEAEPAALAAADLDAFRERVAYLLRPAQEGAPVGGGFRRATLLEQRYVKLAEVQDSFRSGEGQASAVLVRVWRAMEQEMLGRLASGKVSVRGLDGQRRSKSRAQVQHEKAVFAVLRGIAGDGAKHAAEEIDRMRPRAMASEPEAVRVAGVSIKRAVDALDQSMRVTAQVSVQNLWDRMLTEFLNEYVRLQRQGLEGQALYDAMDAFITQLSEAPVLDAAKQASGISYNAGRDATFRTVPQQVARYVVRSEVLDTRTCEVCATLDGFIAEIGSDQYREFMPPAKCLGRDRCRGFYIALGNELPEAA